MTNTFESIILATEIVKKLSEITDLRECTDNERIWIIAAVIRESCESVTLKATTV